MQYRNVLALVVAGVVSVCAVARAQFATSVIDYNSGTGFSPGFTNPAAALGAPTATATPFSPAFRNTQLVSVGSNGWLTLEFNPPLVNNPSNPYGLDFSVYGNSFFVITNNNFSGGGLTSGAIGGNNTFGTRVEVSADGSNWFTLDPALSPTVDSYYPTDGKGDPGIPVNPALTASNFTGLGLAGIRSNYAGSAGGGGFDLAWARDANSNYVDLRIARFVRIDVPGNKSEVDSVATVRGVTPYFAEDFFTNPALDGWQIWGNSNAFSWNPTNRCLDVTWDSSQPNGFFYHSLGTILGRDDDFQISFDLEFFDIAAGVNSNKPDALEVGIGLLNFADATNNLIRGVDSTNVVEFDYFPYFDDPMYGAFAPSVAPAFISSAGAFDGAFGDYLTFTNFTPYTVHMSYTASNATLTTTVSPAGQTNILLTAPASLSGTNDFRVDTFSISSYTDTGDDYDSLLAHGFVANVVVTLPPPAIRNLAAAPASAPGQVQLASRSNWVYTLQRTTDFNCWSNAAPDAIGNGGTLILQDTNPPAGMAFYRVSAAHP